MNLAVIHNKMDRYCGGLECGLHYLSESNLPVCPLRPPKENKFWGQPEKRRRRARQAKSPGPKIVPRKLYVGPQFSG